MAKRRSKSATVLLPNLSRGGPDRIERVKKEAIHLAEQRRFDEAIESLSLELQKAPTRTDLLHEIVRVLLRADRLEEAIDALTVLRHHLANNAEIIKLQGIVFCRMRKFTAAIETLLEASKLLPKDSEIAVSLAQSYEQAGYDHEAVSWITRAVELSPDDVDLRCYAVSVIHHSGRQVEARELLQGNPLLLERPELRLFDAMMMPIVNHSQTEIDQCRSHLEDTLKDLAKLGKTFTNPEKKILGTLFLLGYHGREDRELIQLYADTILKICPELNYRSSNLARPPLNGRKVRLGFVSSNMRTHSVGRVLNRFVGELDRSKFLVTLFELPGKYKGGQEQARELADETVILPESLSSIRARIEERSPDILIFPDFVLEPRSDLLAFSRLAPVQCSTWGHPGTSGRPSMDYWISCQDWEPEGNEKLYTEHLVRLSSPPMIATALEPPAKITSREGLGIPEGTLYGCPQSIYKLHPGFDHILATILSRDRDAHIVLIGGTQSAWVDAFRKRFESRHPAEYERLVILRHLSTEHYLSLLHHCKVALDPIEFGGANTSMEAFVMGLPVITWPGSQVRNRQTYSFYRMMGIDELIVGSEADYIELALKIASDPVLRDRLSNEVKQRCSVIFDTIEVTHELENFFIQSLVNVGL